MILEDIINMTIKRLICRIIIGMAIGGCALVWFHCHRADEMREIRGVVYGDVEQFEMTNNVLIPSDRVMP